MAESLDEQAAAPRIDVGTVPECGIVMPISEIDGCPAAHWTEVLVIITDALASAGFKPSLVSNSGNSPIIQKRIVQNLYAFPLVVCDVSARNPNVMMELGMRLAFDKPTIVIKDDKTGYSFDISPLEHLTYPRDLRYTAMVDFKVQLGNKAKTVYGDSLNGKYAGSYLKSFGDFEIAKINTTEVTSDKFIIDQITSIRGLLEADLHYEPRIVPEKRKTDWFETSFKFPNASLEDIASITQSLNKVFGILQSQISHDDIRGFKVQLITEAHVPFTGRQIEVVVDDIVKARQQETKVI